MKVLLKKRKDTCRKDGKRTRRKIDSERLKMEQNHGDVLEQIKAKDKDKRRTEQEVMYEKREASSNTCRNGVLKNCSWKRKDKKKFKPSKAPREWPTMS